MDKLIQEINALRNLFIDLARSRTPTVGMTAMSSAFVHLARSLKLDPLELVRLTLQDIEDAEASAARAAGDSFDQSPAKA